jgi:hypothetical protein
MHFLADCALIREDYDLAAERNVAAVDANWLAGWRRQTTTRAVRGDPELVVRTLIRRELEPLASIDAQPQRRALSCCLIRRELGQQKVNDASPEQPRRPEPISLSRVLRSAVPSHQKEARIRS